MKINIFYITLTNKKITHLPYTYSVKIKNIIIIINKNHSLSLLVKILSLYVRFCS